MSESIADGAQTREVAAPPFNKRFGADVIFLTSDNVYFYLHKNILSMASTFFEAMFSLAQIPVSSSSSQLPLSPDDSDLPAIEVTEDSLTLDHLLRYCYPVRDPVMADLSWVDRVLGAAIKYALEAVIELAMDSLRRRVEDNPLLAFVIACRYSCEEEACLAAEAVKKKREHWTPFRGTFSETCAGQCYLPEMENLNAVIYDRLICFCLGTLAGTAKFCHHRSRSEGGTSAAGTVVRDPTALYPFNQSSADTVLRSTEGLDFRIHKLLVELQITANPVFPLEGILLTPLDTNHLDEISVIQTKEPRHVLQLLLQLCYPQTPSTCISSWNVAVCCADDTIDTIAAALRYGMMPIVGLYQARLREISSEAPMGVYCISISFGWFELAATVASSMALTTTPFVGDLYPSKLRLDLLTSGEYRRYLEYWHAAQNTIVTTAGGSLYLSIVLSNHARQLSKGSKDSDIRVRSPVAEWVVNNAMRLRGLGNVDVQQAITKSKEMDSKIRVALKSIRLSLY